MRAIGGLLGVLVHWAARTRYIDLRHSDEDEIFESAEQIELKRPKLKGQKSEN